MSKKILQLFLLLTLALSREAISKVKDSQYYCEDLSTQCMESPGVCDDFKSPHGGKTECLAVQNVDNPDTKRTTCAAAIAAAEKVDWCHWRNPRH